MGLQGRSLCHDGIHRKGGDGSLSEEKKKKKRETEGGWAGISYLLQQVFDFLANSRNLGRSSN
jgi:hypothetical protein